MCRPLHGRASRSRARDGATARAKTASSGNPVALEQLGRFHLTRAFVSAFGIDDKNVTTNHERQAEIVHRVLASVEKRYLLVDKSKFGRTGLYRLSARGGFDTIFSG